MHEQDGLWVALRHERENNVFPLECSQTCIMRASFVLKLTVKRVLRPLSGGQLGNSQVGGGPDAFARVVVLVPAGYDDVGRLDVGSGVEAVGGVRTRQP